MPIALDTLPDDPAALKRLIVSQQARITQLEEKLNLLLHKRFAPSSEKAASGQFDLFFNEAEAQLEAAADEEAGEDFVTVPAHGRRKTGRKPLPAGLPRIEVIHDLPEDEQVCPEDGHALKLIGEEISEQLDLIPAKVQVIRHIRKKYACPCCQGQVRLATLPPQPIPKSLASPGLLAQVTVNKFVDGLPLYRQVAILLRSGIELHRGTLAHWMIQAGQLVQPLINLMREELLAYDILQMDETTIQVLKEPGRAATAQSYLWVQRGGPPATPLVLYDYAPTRSASVAIHLLDDYAGWLQSDGYEAYANAAKNRPIRLLGCFAHARRKFDEALKAQGKTPRRAGHAAKGMAYIQKLYRIEQAIKAEKPPVRLITRQQQALPVLEAMRHWLDGALNEVAPGSLTGKAVHYLNQQWRKLIRYAEDGRLSIDNNACENAIRPFVIGRKGWLFCDTVAGAKSSANLYSLVETAKANGLEPYGYLRRVFTELPKARTLEDIEALLPYPKSDDVTPQIAEAEYAVI